MANYIVRRLLLIIPTLFGIMLINFAIVQAAPGGPVDLMIANMQGQQLSATARIGGSSVGDVLEGGSRSKQGLDPEIIRRIEKMYGFDKPAPQRFYEMLVNYARFDFGESFYRNASVTDLILEKLPVSISPRRSRTNLSTGLVQVNRNIFQLNNMNGFPFSEPQEA